eukprot:scaffold25412_cov64-Phaeocystis_antarctica.AAC.6
MAYRLHAHVASAAVHAVHAVGHHGRKEKVAHAALGHAVASGLLARRAESAGRGEGVARRARGRERLHHAVGVEGDGCWPV